MSTNAADIDRLLQTVAQGDRSAFGAIYDELAPLVFGLARRVIRNDAIAEEVLQEVMLEVWRNSPRYDPDRGSARAWVSTIAHRRAVDRVRAEESARRRDEAAQRPERPYDSVVEHIERSEDRASVSSSLESLTELQRQTIQLSYYDGLTYDEISIRLAVPVNTIKTRMRDGLTSLRGTYEAHR